MFRPHMVLITGGAGFIGSHLVRHVLDQDPDVRVATLDSLTYSGSLERLTDVTERNGVAGDGRHFFVPGDVRDAAKVSALLRGAATESSTGRGIPPVDAVIHAAAESHVDRSIHAAPSFVSTNVGGTVTLLECVRQELDIERRAFRLVNVSTDEVYGSLEPGDRAFGEEDPLAPNNPYSASKAGADCLVRSYRKTFGLPCLTTRGANTYGVGQSTEKLIPRMITRLLRGQSLPVYGDGLHSREWLNVADHAAAIWAVCTRGLLEDAVYNVAGESERTNMDVVRAILAVLGKPDSGITYVADRPGHDRRYAMNGARLRDRLGWTPTIDFERGLRDTVEWYVTNERWWRGMESSIGAA